MVDGLGWLYRPVLRGMCKEESLYDGTLDLYRVWLMNEAITVDDENRRRVDKAMIDRGR